ncbi:MAG: DUF1559 domain-containing protein [Pirellulaceae bacterium]|nr:DUF1559 domain-containing protein [Pirellulaceae bacterium]
MAFEFVCPFCHVRSRVDDRFVGLSGPCAECGKPVTMPGRAKAASYEESLDSHSTTSNGPPTHSSIPIDRLEPSKSRSVSWVIGLFTLVIAIALASLATIFIYPTARNAMLLRQRTLGLSNAKQIADALNTYRRTHSSYPTPSVVDESGKPLYSWRVLILPQLGYSSLYEQFQLDQAWDSPTNISLIHKMPPVFACPDNSTALSMHQPNFALIVGPGTLFPPSGAIDPDTMRDNSAETLLVVETKDGLGSWTQPGDLDSKNGIILGSRPMVDIGGNYTDCVIAVTVDGTPLAIDRAITKAKLDAIISPNGEEDIDLNLILRTTKR